MKACLYSLLFLYPRETYPIWYKVVGDKNHVDLEPTFAGNATISVVYHIQYKANGGEGAPAEQTKIKDETITLSSTTPTRTGYVFAGWGTSATSKSPTYQPGAAYSENKDITLYALWSDYKIYFDQRNESIIAYDGNGGINIPEAQKKQQNVDIIIPLNVPLKDGCIFIGWGRSPSDKHPLYKPGDTYSADVDIVLYALWADYKIHLTNANDEIDYLCFTAKENNSTVSTYIETQYGPVPNPPTLEYSKDLLNWSPFVVDSTVVTLNAGEKMYLRGDNPYFSPPGTNYGNVVFKMTGKIAASGDLMSLLDKSCKSTTISTEYCFSGAFMGCNALISPPKLTATSLSYGCYYWLFHGCTNLKISSTQTEDYQTPFRIPASGTGTAGSYALYQMFDGTGGSFKGTPSINTTYYVQVPN